MDGRFKTNVSSQEDPYKATSIQGPLQFRPGRYKGTLGVQTLGQAMKFGSGEGLLVHALGTVWSPTRLWHSSMPSEYKRNTWSRWGPQKQSYLLSCCSAQRAAPGAPVSQGVLKLSSCCMSTHLLPWAHMSLFTCQGSGSFRVYSTRKGGAAGHDAERLPPQETSHGWQNEKPCEYSKKGSLEISSAFTFEQVRNP